MIPILKECGDRRTLGIADEAPSPLVLLKHQLDRRDISPWWRKAGHQLMEAVVLKYPGHDYRGNTGIFSVGQHGKQIGLQHVNRRVIDPPRLVRPQRIDIDPLHEFISERSLTEQSAGRLGLPGTRRTTQEDQPHDRSVGPNAQTGSSRSNTGLYVDATSPVIRPPSLQWARENVVVMTECGDEVVVFDLWVDGATIADTVADFGLSNRIRPVYGDARQLPFDDDAIDVVVCVDAFEYVGTDTGFLPSLARVVKPGGRIGVSTPGLAADPYDADPPSAVSDLIGAGVAAWHSPGWWVRHWQLSGVVANINARMQIGGHADWLAWSRAMPDDTATTDMLQQVPPDQVGIVLITATRATNPS